MHAVTGCRADDAATAGGPRDLGDLRDRGGQASSTAGTAFPLRWGSRAGGQDPEKWAREAAVGAGSEGEVPGSGEQEGSPGSCPVGTGTGQADHWEPAAPRITSPTGPSTDSGLPSPGLDLETYTLQVARVPGPQKWENLGSFWRRVPDEPADLCFPVPNTGSVVAPPASSL